MKNGPIADAIGPLRQDQAAMPTAPIARHEAANVRSCSPEDPRPSAMQPGSPPMATMSLPSSRRMLSPRKRRKKAPRLGGAFLHLAEGVSAESSYEKMLLIGHIPPFVCASKTFPSGVFDLPFDRCSPVNRRQTALQAVLMLWNE
jgi:hypothetical protein